MINNKIKLVPGKLYRNNSFAWVVYHNKTQKICSYIPKNSIFLYLNHEPYENPYKKCIRINILFEDKILRIEKLTLERFLNQIQLP